MPFKTTRPKARSGVSTGAILAKLSLIAAIFSGVGLAWSNKEFVANASEILGLAPSPVFVLGTGSMAPTFPVGKGDTPEEREQEVVEELPTWRYPGGVAWNGWEWGRYTLQHGDLVFVRDSKPGNVVGSNGVIKRVIGLPGDTIELRDGFVIRNGKTLVEPYTLTGRSTYGGTHIDECIPTKVPDNAVFILGDNRKRSDDSRFRLGFVPLSDITRYFPWEKQPEMYGSRWRTDAENDAKLAGSVTFDANDFFQKVNALRQASGLKPLVRSNGLNQVAVNRARQWASDTTPATGSGTLLAAAKSAGYTNPLLAEIPVPGAFTSQELVDAVGEISSWSELLLRPDYSEIGLGTYISTAECPKQSTVIFLGGYVPANYDAAMVESWEKALERLHEVKPSWTELDDPAVGFSDEQERDLKRLLDIIDTRIERVSELVRTMQRREWLTETQKAWLAEDERLAEEQLELSRKLNAQ